MNTPPARPRPPDAPVLIAHPQGAVWRGTDGTIARIPRAEAAKLARQAPPLLCHRGAVAARLGIAPFAALDILELFAFARPARFAVPTVRGLAEALELAPPRSHEEEAELLPRAALLLLGELARETARAEAAGDGDLAAIARGLDKARWTWAPAVTAATAATGAAGTSARARAVWDRLAEWSEHAPEPPPGSLPVTPSEARARLAAALGEDAEERPGQADYASAAALAFQPRDEAGAPNVVLAEAGTGTGKTMGYLAPASLWAERNRAPVWLSTYTRNLQRQLDGEAGRLYPDPAEKARRVVIRKGRENYFCLLNFEEATRRAATGGDDAVVHALMARWAKATRDGDMVGGDLPGWLGELMGRGRMMAMADRRGECIHAACPHYRKCFIERTIRRARRADLVIANHALVMVQAALGGLDDATVPARLVFDEGHHVFDAADGAFSACLSGIEAAEMRRWIVGAEAEGRRTRARGLQRRCEDLAAVSDAGVTALDESLGAARALPGPGWHQRLAGDGAVGEAEAFLLLLRRQVLARASGHGGPYSLECEPGPAIPGLVEAARALERALARLAAALTRLDGSLTAQLDQRAGELDSSARQRIEAISAGIRRRALMPLAAWRAMLDGLDQEPAPESDFVDWFAVERSDGRETDIAFHRRWIDPTRPFAEFVAKPAHGVLITSATLRDGSGDEEADWRAAERRTGTVHLPRPAIRAALASPFDYAARARAVVVTDVRKDDLAQVAAAYRELFLAAGGGALGLFTAISRLTAVRDRIAGPLDAAGIPLLSQHGDGMDTTTVVDIFRAEEDSCLLGTDAVRDGVDVPGRSLRLIVFDRVPWPRPDILHKARRQAFGGRAYDDMLTRLRLKQAFGRLLRRADDAGVFVLLDPMMPSRLAGAFPPGVTPQRLGLAEAVALVREFLAAGGTAREIKA